MSDIEALRTALAKIDDLRTIEQAAEAARVKIRLSEKPVAKNGLLGFLRRDNHDREAFFDQDETTAIYGALAVVRDNCRRSADHLERDLSGSTDGKP